MGSSNGGPGGAELAADLRRHLLGFDDVLRFALLGSRLLEARYQVGDLARGACLGGRDGEGDLEGREREVGARSSGGCRAGSFRGESLIGRCQGRANSGLADGLVGSLTGKRRTRRLGP
eukprot:2049717-Alexandrium_andersonii.AAC.1